jgi:hypothetical protein
LPADAVPITPNSTLRIDGWSKKSILIAPDPVPSWEKWVLKGWTNPEEIARERLLERNNYGIYPWTGYCER